MKKIILPLLLFGGFGYSALAQCTDPISLPYLADAESAIVPELPACVYSGYMAFSSNKVFKTTDGPVAGFAGNVFVYDTTVSEGITENAWVAVNLGTAMVSFNEGNFYQVSFRYGMDNPEGMIGMLRISLYREGEYIYLHEEESIDAGTVSGFLSEPFTIAETGSYDFIIEIQMEGGQGNLYLDDIAIEEAPTASVEENSFSDFTIYPNPVKDFLNITGTGEINRAEVYTLHGQKVIENDESNIQQINIQGLANGVYILKVHSANASKSIKLIKE